MTREIAYFMWDRTDAGTIKRARSLRAIGFHVIGFSFRRRRYNPGAEPEWENVDLGLVTDRSYLARIPNLMYGLLSAWRMRRRLREVPYFLARGLDLCLFALAVRWLIGGRQPVIYEVYDVHFTLLEDSLRGAHFRWLERRALKRVHIVAVTAPAYARIYFAERQGYCGPYFVVENKLPGEVLQETPANRVHPPWQRGARPLIIGWFGALRCNESVEILRRAALALPDELEIHLRGWPSEMPGEEFQAIVDGVPNMTYFGPFRSPEDLAAIYGAIDLNWAVDLQFRGGNSDWLLPFRLYEGGYHNVPALGAAGLAAAAKVEELDLGWNLSEPYAENLVEFVRRLDRTALEAKRAHLRSLPRTLFAGDDDLKALFDAVDATTPTRSPGALAPGGRQAA
jgi:succinoglycan biosynthesis protein ExoL